MTDLILCAGIFSASVVSGMLGIGVAFAAIPILGIGGLDLVTQIQPSALFLNALTALFAAISFAKAGFVNWPRSLALAAVGSVFSPVGAFMAEKTGEALLWGSFFAAVLLVVYLLSQTRPTTKEALSFRQVLWLSAPISAFSGLLGVGPGFLLVPLMVYAGFAPRWAAAISAVAVIPSSLLSLIPHIEHASVDVTATLPIAVSAAVGALLGGHLSSTRVPEIQLRRLFMVVIVALSIYKAVSLVNSHSHRSVDNSLPSDPTSTSSAAGAAGSRPGA
jgi:uncharacterized protein